MIERTGFIRLALVISMATVGSGLLAGCSSTPTSSPSTTPPATVTPATPSTPPSTPATPAVSGLELGKLIFATGADNTGPIPTTGGIPSIKVNACKNCHGDNAKGGKKLPGPDIRGSVLQPSFTEAKFATAVTTGVDDTGKRLHKTMPRFSASAEDTDALWLYLNSLK
jgi:hypothetical protein